MSDAFFTKTFDDATMLKLNIFRQYIREWLPVFMTRSKSGTNKVADVRIYDFFAGSGRDAEGNPGSPLIIIEELKSFCSAMTGLKGNVSVKLYFNDIRKSYVEKLKQAIDEIACDESCCDIQYSNLSFVGALANHLPAMTSNSAAHLVIMDQFGVKDVTPDVVQKLLRCRNTDILFFISTSFIHRFIETPEIGSKFPMNAGERRNVKYNIIHRHLCEYYKKCIDDDSFYIAPFSIRKGSNIYGVMFGTKHLLGLEKFLKVCWALDAKTGEANYNIDRDFIWHGRRSLFDEDNRFKKIDLFESELREYICEKRPGNVALNKFCLTKGFPPAKAKEALAALQDTEELRVWDIAKNGPARKGAFYLGWDNCKSGKAKVRFSMEKKP